MRLFIAIDLLPILRDPLAALQSRLAQTKAAVRWTDPAQFHLTLGRIHSNHSLNRLLRLMSKHKFDPLGQFQVAAITLYQSAQTTLGSICTPINTAGLSDAIL